MQLALLGLCAASPPAPARAEPPREITKMADILGAIDADTWVVFDIDNTLIAPKTPLGSDQWYSWLEQKKGPSQAMIIWNSVQKDLEIAPVEPGTPELVRMLQKRSVPTLALTARTSDIREVTKRQLAAAGISFEGGAAGARELVLDEKRGARLAYGILFIGEQNEKGPMLITLLEKLEAKPKRIVFVDDKKRNVDSVGRAVAAAGMDARMFRYGAEDARVRAFRGEAADAEYRAWQKRAAESRAPSRPSP